MIYDNGKFLPLTKNKIRMNRKAASNKPLAYMAADVITLTPVLRKTISDYPRCLEIETATNASAKTLPVS